MTSTGIDFRSGRMFFTVPRWTTRGYPLQVFYAEAPKLEPIAVGDLARRALDAARMERSERSDPAEVRAQSEQLYEVAGVPDWTTYVRGTAHVGVEEHHGVVVVLPSRNAGSSEGFVYKSEAGHVNLESPTILELGHSILAALRASGARPARPPTAPRARAVQRYAGKRRHGLAIDLAWVNRDWARRTGSSRRSPERSRART